MKSETVVAGVVLAGGRSRRMGSDKAGLEYGGIKLLDRAYLLLEATIGSDESVWVSGEYSGFRCIPDLLSYQGPLGGVMSFFQHFNDVSRDPESSIVVLVIPVDMPGLNSQTLRLLLAGIEESADVLRAFQGYELPFLVRIDERVDEVLKELMGSGTSGRLHSLRAMREELCKRYPEFVNLLPVPTSACFDNLNTPDEWGEHIRRIDCESKTIR